MEGHGGSKHKTIAALWSKPSPSAAKLATPLAKESAGQSNGSQTTTVQVKNDCIIEIDLPSSDNVAIAIAPEATPLPDRCEVSPRCCFLQLMFAISVTSTLKAYTLWFVGALSTWQDCFSYTNQHLSHILQRAKRAPSPSEGGRASKKPRKNNGSENGNPPDAPAVSLSAFDPPGPGTVLLKDLLQAVPLSDLLAQLTQRTESLTQTGLPAPLIDIEGLGPGAAGPFSDAKV